MADVAFFRDNLDYRFTEWTVLDDKSDLPVFAMMTTNEQSHDLGLLGDRSGVLGRIHHLAYWLDQRLDVERAADMLMEAGVPIEYGPGRHGMGFQTYLYFREPGGMRIELNSGGWRNYQPDWQPVRWTPAQGSNDFYRQNKFPDSMMQAFPPHEAGASPSANVINPWAAASVR
jgi:catechol 2,3-dioxygenase